MKVTYKPGFTLPEGMDIIAIDPGVTAAIAYSTWEGLNQQPSVMKMPTTARDLWDALENMRTVQQNSFCFIEQVGTYVEGNSGPSAAKFAEHCGQLRMALAGLKIPTEYVLPAKWQIVIIGKPKYEPLPPIIKGESPEALTRKKLRKIILAKRKTERKNKIKARMQELYPHLRVTLVNADALGIYHYARQMMK